MVLTLQDNYFLQCHSVQDKKWFFNGIDVYRTTSSYNVIAVQDKNGSSMVLTLQE